jgi:two-component system CheB/CheR fusion protein
MLRILVVDDSQDSATSMQLLLQVWGYEAHVASDGPTAIRMAESFRPDVMILDIDLPGMDGYEVAKRLRKSNSETPFIVIHSGHCTDADMRRSLMAGFIAHLPKPVDPGDIRKILVICDKWLHLNPPSPREEGPRPTASLPVMPNSEA